ncbi:hypothetical protein FOE78_02125 [Microlunatus elymi]|uniref:Uncharacterized protein n=1 Tax=Microlunatus elymi TaxID=2596828 RepID=A0A516PUK2_9ACTN|nr:hypothetical protein [Microlunatus elymi]QDP94874.1 hypothetical protein FOE78_02125 [Microlunatus elymi]
MSMQPMSWGGPAGPNLVSIGNIHATTHHVMTPAGTWPIADINVTSIDQTSTTSRTPTWAIVLAVVLVWFFLLSLLFLLVRETRVQGFISVTVTTIQGRSYTEQVPVIDPLGRADVFNRVTYLQSLIGQERFRLGR